MSDVFCYGDETSLSDCYLGDPSACGPDEGAGVICDDGKYQCTLIDFFNIFFQ